jgi:hypothetical protein
MRIIKEQKGEKHKASDPFGTKETYEMFGKLRFRRMASVKGIDAARIKYERFKKQGYLVRVEEEARGHYNIYIHNKVKRS